MRTPHAPFIWDFKIEFTVLPSPFFRSERQIRFLELSTLLLPCELSIRRSRRDERGTRRTAREIKRYLLLGARVGDELRKVHLGRGLRHDVIVNDESRCLIDMKGAGEVEICQDLIGDFRRVHVLP